jgi:AcrR family transcriptional regulator
MTDQPSLTKSDRTRRIILESAYTLFSSQGYAATSMRQIKEDAGLALGSIYNHFASKEEMFQAILAERHPYLRILPLLKDAHGETMEEFLRNAARSLVTELEQHPEFLNLMLIELVEFKGKHARILFGIIFPDVMLIAQRIGVYQSELRPIPLPVLLRAFLGMFFSYFITDLLLKDMMPAEMRENSLDLFVDIFMHGIQQSPNPSFTNPVS